MRELVQRLMIDLFPSELGAAIIHSSDAKKELAAGKIEKAILEHAEEVSTELAYAVALLTKVAPWKKGIWKIEGQGYIVFIEMPTGCAYHWGIQSKDVFLFTHLEPVDITVEAAYGLGQQHTAAQAYLRSS